MSYYCKFYSFFCFFSLWRNNYTTSWLLFHRIHMRWWVTPYITIYLTNTFPYKWSESNVLLLYIFLFKSNLRILFQSKTQGSLGCNYKIWHCRRRKQTLLFCIRTNIAWNVFYICSSLLSSQGNADKPVHFLVSSFLSPNASWIPFLVN